MARPALVGLFLCLWIIPRLVNGRTRHRDNPVYISGSRCEVGTCGWNNDTPHPHKTAVPAECSLVMAPSTLDGDSNRTGWGVFTLTDRLPGTAVLPGDVVVQIIDLPQQQQPAAHLPSIQRLIHDYLWSSEETGGFYEGQHVISAPPGISMLANGLPSANVVPHVPMVNETESTSPSAGATTAYHSWTFFTSTDKKVPPIRAGDELFINYGPGWFHERQQRVSKAIKPLISTEKRLDWLRSNGRCLDGFVPLAQSTIAIAGRGVAASRGFEKGSIVLPVPVLAIANRSILEMQPRQRVDGSWTKPTQQLLLNYCLGHSKSDVLLYPYGPTIQLINHALNNQANVRWQWSTLSRPRENVTLDNLYEWQNPNSAQSPTFLLELVATRTIEEGDEILLNYGSDWEKAWQKHVAEWKLVSNTILSYELERALPIFPTTTELTSQPYPDNIFTSCYYRYDSTAGTKKEEPGRTVASVVWNFTHGIYSEPGSIRPCTVLARTRTSEGEIMYTVQMHNRYGLRAPERIAKGVVHVVEQVPAKAIRLSDKLYTTRQHMEGAFRHAIDLPNNVFPEHWKRSHGRPRFKK